MISQLDGSFASLLQQWSDACAHLSEAIQTHIHATKLFELSWTPSGLRSIPGCAAAIENHLQLIEDEKLHLHKATIALKQARNLCISPFCRLPFELISKIFTTATASTSHDTSGRYVKQSLSHVCSRWRQIALDVCPVWDVLSLTFEIDDTTEPKLAVASIELHSGYYGYIEEPVHRPLGFDDTQYAQTILDIISPYMKQLDRIGIAVDNVEQIRPFLELLLEKGVPRSVLHFDLSVNQAALVFPQTQSHWNNRMSQFFRRIKVIALSSVGLDWSSTAFDRLVTMSLLDLPVFCCPTLEQFARMLSTCPGLQTLHLERVTIPASEDSMAPEPIELEHLDSLTLKEVDVRGVLSIIALGSHELGVELGGVADDIDTLESLRSFIGRTNVRELGLTLPETRSDQALSRLVRSTTRPLLGLRCLTLSDMNLRASELNLLASHSLPENNQILHPALVDPVGTFPQIDRLEVWFCTIDATPEGFRNAVSAIHCIDLRLALCKHVFTDPEDNGVTEVLELDDSTSEFATRLCALMPNRVIFG